MTAYTKFEPWMIGQVVSVGSTGPMPEATGVLQLYIKSGSGQTFYQLKGDQEQTQLAESHQAFIYVHTLDPRELTENIMDVFDNWQSSREKNRDSIWKMVTKLAWRRK